jgi:hypothetical protein
MFAREAGNHHQHLFTFRRSLFGNNMPLDVEIESYSSMLKPQILDFIRLGHLNRCALQFGNFYTYIIIRN